MQSQRVMAVPDTARHKAKVVDVTSQQDTALSIMDYLRYLTPQRLGKLLFGIVVSLVLGELAIGWWSPQQEVLQKDLIAPDPTRGFHLVSNFHGVMSMNGVPFSTNSWGLRDREYGERPAGGVRLYVIGDSVVFGYGVAIEQTFTRFLEGVLQRRLERPVEVVNGGIPGYGTLQELDLFEQTVATVKPDVVILGVTILNDLADNVKYAGGGAVQHHPPAGIGSLLSWLRGHSQLYLLLRRYKSAVSGEKMMQIHAVRPPAGVQRALGLTEDALDRFARAAQRRGVAFAIALMPTDRQVSSARWSEVLAKYHLPANAYAADQPDRQLLDFAQRRGIPTLDLLPALRAHEHETLYFSDHWTPHGHALVADAIADFALQAGLVDRRPAAATVAAQ